jgi:hypothetical protein
MTVKIKVRLPLFLGLRQTTPSFVGAAAAGSSFQTTLSGCMNGWIGERSAHNYHAPSGNNFQTVKKALTQAWLWMHAKYAQTATKRLRLAETLQLGEKRFVALVSVEGREFLIGGGTSGVSLLAQLGPRPESALIGDRDDEGDSE